MEMEDINGAYPADFWQNLLCSVIDETSIHFTSISDEEMVEDYADHGVFERSFLHEAGNSYVMRWRVYYGSPDTVRTVFENTKITKG
jgi:hypothetical protein